MWGVFLLCAGPWAMIGKAGVATDLQEGLASRREGLSHKSLRADGSWKGPQRDRCLPPLLGAGTGCCTFRETLGRKKALG